MPSLVRLWCCAFLAGVAVLLAQTSDKVEPCGSSWSSVSSKPCEPAKLADAPLMYGFNTEARFTFTGKNNRQALVGRSSLHMPLTQFTDLRSYLRVKLTKAKKIIAYDNDASGEMAITTQPEGTFYYEIFVTSELCEKDQSAVCAIMGSVSKVVIAKLNADPEAKEDKLCAALESDILHFVQDWAGNGRQ